MYLIIILFVQAWWSRSLLTPTRPSATRLARTRPLRWRLSPKWYFFSIPNFLIADFLLLLGHSLQRPRWDGCRGRTQRGEGPACHDRCRQACRWELTPSLPSVSLWTTSLRSSLELRWGRQVSIDFDICQYWDLILHRLLAPATLNLEPGQGKRLVQVEDAQV